MDAEMIEALKDFDINKMIECLAQNLKEKGKLTPEVQDILDRMIKEMEAMDRAQEGMSNDMKIFMFEMEYKEKIDNLFIELYRATWELNKKE